MKMLNGKTVDPSFHVNCCNFTLKRNRNMIRIWALLCALFGVFTSTAQQSYFIYLQTEGKQPFYVQLGPRVYSSTLSGYLVLSNLKDSTYSISFGLPGNKLAPQKFTLQPNGADRGFEVKDFGEKGWGLYDWRTATTVYTDAQNPSVPPNSAVVGAPEGQATGNSTPPFTASHSSGATDTLPGNGMVEGNEQTAATGRPIKLSGTFIDRLAMVVDDASIKQKPAPIVTAKVAPTIEMSIISAETKEGKSISILPAGADSLTTVQKKEGEVAEEQKGKLEVIGGDSSTTTTTTTADKTTSADKLVEVKQEPEGKQQKETAPKSLVIKKSMTRVDNGFMGVYIIDYSAGYRDTVKVFVPDVPEDQFSSENLMGGNNTQISAENKETKASAEYKEINTALASKETNTANASKETNTTNASKETKGANMGQKEGAGKLEEKDSGNVKPPAFLDFTIQPIKKDSASGTEQKEKVKDSAVVDQPVKDSIVVEQLGKDSIVVGQPTKDSVEVDQKRIDTVKIEGVGRKIATEEDFLALRRTMVVQENEDDMVYVARKQFREMAFTTEQVKKLGALFLKEESLLRFLEAAYPFVADPNNFEVLGELLKDNYYKNRFKALLGKKGEHEEEILL